MDITYELYTNSYKTGTENSPHSKCESCIFSNQSCEMQSHSFEGLHILQTVTWAVGTNNQCPWLELDGPLPSQQVWCLPLQKVPFNNILHVFHSTDLEVGAPLTAPHLVSFSDLPLGLFFWYISHLAPIPIWIQVTQVGSTSLYTCITAGTTLPDPGSLGFSSGPCSFETLSALCPHNQQWFLFI